MPRPLPSRWPGLVRGRPRLRRTAATLTSLAAVVATSLVAGPSAVAADGSPCRIGRTDAHHSEGVDSWNGAYPRPVRTLDAVMVFLSFPDSGDLIPPKALAADHFPATSDFFTRASYGKFRLRAHPRQEWIRMPKPSTAYRIQRDWDASARNDYVKDALQSSDPLVDFSRYDIVYLVADPDAPGVDSDATKVVNFDEPRRADGTDVRRLVTVFERHPPDRNVLAHETGHVFDLPDLYHRPEGDGKGDWDTHVGDWDLMGSQFGLAPELFAWHKWRLGWLGDRDVYCSRGSGTVRLEPVAAPPSPPPTTTAAGPGGRLSARPQKRHRLAVIRTGRDEALVLEARSRTGNDRATCTEGVLLYRVRGDASSGDGPMEVVDTHPRTDACWGDSVYPPLADAPMRVGESFRVPGERLTISVQGRSADGDWRVRIQPG